MQIKLPGIGLSIPLALFLAACPAFADDPPAPEAAAPADKAPAPAKAGVEWVADFDKAVERAKAEKKDLFVEFTGSDWCPYCVKLHDEIFAKPEFAPLAQDYVLVSLDFPHHDEAKARVPNPARNEELRAKYQVDGFPAVFLMTAEGDVFTRTGYLPGGAAKYVEALTKSRARGRASLVAAAAIEKEFPGAKDEARTALIEKAVALFEQGRAGDAWAEKIVHAARAALAADPDNAKGLQLRAVKAMLRAGVSDAELLESARKFDPKNERGALELAVVAQVGAVDDDVKCRAAMKAIDELDALGPIKDREMAQVVYANAAFWNQTAKLLNDHEKAVVYAKKLRAVAEKNDPRFAELIEDILGGEGKDEGGPKHEGHDRGGAGEK